MKKLNSFHTALKLLLLDLKISYSYDAGNGNKGQVWFESKANKIFYKLDCNICGSFTMREAKALIKKAESL